RFRRAIEVSEPVPREGREGRSLVREVAEHVQNGNDTVPTDPNEGPGPEGSSVVGRSVKITRTVRGELGRPSLGGGVETVKNPEAGLRIDPEEDSGAGFASGRGAEKRPAWIDDERSLGSTVSARCKSLQHSEF